MAPTQAGAQGVVRGSRRVTDAPRSGSANAALQGAMTWALTAVGLIAVGLLGGGGPWVSASLFVLGAVGLGGPNPPLDSACLDVVHPNTWGRTEGIRGTMPLAGMGVA